MAIFVTPATLNQTRVLRLPGQPDCAHIYCGKFWPLAESLGSCFWDCWVKPRSSGYFVSDGYGGAHAILWGLSAVPGVVNGNVYLSGAGASFGGGYTINSEEWVHLALSWYSVAPGRIRVWVNGVGDGMVVAAGPRTSPALGGNGYLYIGGSDHQNFGGDIAMLRCWDRGAIPGPITLPWAFWPDRLGHLWASLDGTVPCDGFWDVTQGAANHIPDGSSRGVSHTAGDADARVFHPGKLFTTAGVITHLDEPVGGQMSRHPLPTWVVDNTCPWGRSLHDPNLVLPNENIPAPGSPPGGCLAFDSFGRRNQTYAFQPSPTLGSTEGGSLGPLAWTVSPVGGHRWGILGGYACCLSAGVSMAWVNIGTGEQDVRVTRRHSTYDTGECGLAFRVDAANPLNHGRVSWQDVSGAGDYRFVVKRFDNGSEGAAGSFNLSHAADTWGTMRVTCIGTTIQVYVDNGGAGWTAAGDPITSSTYQTATGAGLASHDGVTFASSFARHKNFTAYTAS